MARAKVSAEASAGLSAGFQKARGLLLQNPVRGPDRSRLYL